jgi:hypothetical protein
MAVLAGVVLARTGPHHTAASSRSKPLPSALAGVRGSHAPAAGSAARWPSAAGACGSTVYLPQIHLARQTAGVRVRMLVGGTGLRQVTLGGVVSRPLPGLPDHGQLVTTLVAGPGAGYAFDLPCTGSSASVRVYRIVAGAAHRLGTSADALLGGPQQAWAVTYLAQYTVLTPVLTPLTGGRRLTLQARTNPVADTAAGLVVVAYHEWASRPDTVELLDPATGVVVRRMAEGSLLGAAGHVALVSLPGCGMPSAHRGCTLESIDLTTGRPTARFDLPAGRVPVPDAVLGPNGPGAVFSPGGTAAAFQLARARPDPRFTAGLPLPPADLVVLHLHTGSLDIVPGLELPPATQTGLAFDTTGRWLLATVSQGDHGELLAWRQGMPGPGLVTSLPGRLLGPPPLLPVRSWWRTG